MRLGDDLKHVSVLLREALSALAIRPNGFYVDSTFGRGGHSRAILANLDVQQGFLYALDRDPEAMHAAQILQTQYANFKPIHGTFANLAMLLAEHGVLLGTVDGVLFDLGVSSPQIDTPLRGFSFRQDGPLDMRMDPGHGQPVSEWLASASEREIAQIIWEYGEERFARAIARALVNARERNPLISTLQVANIIAHTIPRHEKGQDPATRTFQAWRIFINQELSELKTGLVQAFQLLKAGGRLVVISFHSLEDRLVKLFMQVQAKPELAYPELHKLPLVGQYIPRPSLRILGKPIRASVEETADNPRARSAILRVAEKLINPLVPMHQVANDSIRKAWL